MKIGVSRDDRRRPHIAGQQGFAERGRVRLIGLVMGLGEDAAQSVGGEPPKRRPSRWIAQRGLKFGGMRRDRAHAINDSVEPPIDFSTKARQRGGRIAIQARSRRPPRRFLTRYRRFHRVVPMFRPSRRLFRSSNRNVGSTAMQVGLRRETGFLRRRAGAARCLRRIPHRCRYPDPRFRAAHRANRCP